MTEEVKHTFMAYALQKKNLTKKEVMKDFKADSSLGQNDVFCKISDDKRSGIFLFSFGVLVYWNISNLDGSDLVSQVFSSFGLSSLIPDFTDELVVIESEEKEPSVEWNRVILDKLTIPRAEVIARVLAQSVALDYSESDVDYLMRNLTRQTEKLVKWHKIPWNPKIIQGFVFETVAFRKDLTAQIAILDRPEALWDDRTMDAMFASLRNMFDLTERYDSMEYKIKLIQESLDLIVHTIRDKRIVIIELAIVVLFLLELIVIALE